MDSYPALDIRYPLDSGTSALQELLHALLDDYHPFAIAEYETANGWRVFFREPAQRDAALAALREEFGARLTSISGYDVADDEWARRSQARLRAVRVGRIVVAPPWDVPVLRASANAEAPAADIVVVIDPSMGFGTGHHETTRLCLQLLQQLDLTGRRVIDVGTGSGVLAIAARKLGAHTVIAVDSDPDALLNARENIARNGTMVAIQVREATLDSLSLAPADVVLANLTGTVLQRHAATLGGLVANEGVLIVSGFSPKEAPAVAAALGGASQSTLVEGDWAALLMDRPKAIQ